MSGGGGGGAFRGALVIWWTSLVHYANTPMQYTAIFHGCKNESFRAKIKKKMYTPVNPTFTI